VAGASGGQRVRSPDRMGLPSLTEWPLNRLSDLSNGGFRMDQRVVRLGCGISTFGARELLTSGLRASSQPTSVLLSSSLLASSRLKGQSTSRESTVASHEPASYRTLSGWLRPAIAPSTTLLSSPPARAGHSNLAIQKVARHQPA